MTGYDVYIIYSKSTNKYYIGQTNDFDHRFEEHNSIAETGYTIKYRPWSLFYKFKVQSRSIALKLEKYLKKKPRKFILRIKEDVELQEYINDRFFD